MTRLAKATPVFSTFRLHWSGEIPQSLPLIVMFSGLVTASLMVWLWLDSGGFNVRPDTYIEIFVGLGFEAAIGALVYVRLRRRRVGAEQHSLANLFLAALLVRAVWAVGLYLWSV